MNNETYIDFFGMLGIFLISLHKMKYMCPPSRIEYRYIKRTFAQQQSMDETGQYGGLTAGEYEGGTAPAEKTENPKEDKQKANTNPFG